MPTREQMEAVTREIAILKGGLNVVRLSGDRVVEASEGQGQFLFWDDLDGQQRQGALSAAIDWEGFTESQMEDVINRVLDGEEPDMWMNGVEVDGPSNQAPDATLPEELSQIDLAELALKPTSGISWNGTRRRWKGIPRKMWLTKRSAPTNTPPGNATTAKRTQPPTDSG